MVMYAMQSWLGDDSNDAQVQMSLEEMANYPRPLLAEQPNLAEDSFCQVNISSSIRTT